MKAKTLMVMGTSSSCGKSLLVTALCRIFSRRRLRVLPFKAQNMSNNAAVCAGGEIGRAQAEQAFACGVEPSVLMNPILLKPEANNRSQVVILGKARHALSAMDYYAQKAELWNVVRQSLDTLRGQADLVIIEGAGSPVELNLMKDDIVNLAVARYADAPCLLVGDIDRGGIFAQLLGTLWLIPEEDRRLVKGFVVNKFRGDLRLFSPGIDMLEARSGVKVFGVVPYLDLHGVADEDAVSVEEAPTMNTGEGLDIAVIHLPRISNFDDFDPLRNESQVRIRYVHSLKQLGKPDVIFLPGTKSTISDLAWLGQQGLAKAIVHLAKQGRAVIGICGGYQMMGRAIYDPYRVESNQEKAEGLALLPVETWFYEEKATYRAKARVISKQGFWSNLTGTILEGYEIHAGKTASERALFDIRRVEDAETQHLDGFSSDDGKIFGTYMHGLFVNDYFRQVWLRSFGVEPTQNSYLKRKREAFDNLADVVESVIKINEIMDI